MDRSFSRIATLICSASAVGLLAGCASTGPGAAVLGVPRAGTSPPAQASGDVLAGIEQAITIELNAVSATQSDNEAPEALVLLEALNNPSKLVQAQNFEHLQALGADAASKRERVVEALISEIQNDSFLHGVSVNGRGLASWMVTILDGVNSQLGALTSSISAGALTDQVRADLISINASTRVYGLIEPMVHLALAGGDELAEINTLTSREAQLAKLVTPADPTYASDEHYLADMASNLRSAVQTVDAGISSVLSLTAAGFPGNRSTIVTVRASLTQARTPLGAAQGEADALAINLGLAS